MVSQEAIFVAGEGDRWFERNKEALGRGDVWQQDYTLRMMALYDIRPESVLEIGAANGWRLNAIEERFPNCDCWGIEPSLSAIADSRERFPRIMVRHDTAATMRPSRYPFDLVLVPFVLHWIGRPALLQSLTNIDASVKHGGYLIVTDFAPDAPTVVPYSHRKGVATYKADYLAVFTATGLYREVAHRIFDHDSHAEAADIPSERRAICGLLRKEM